MGSTCRTEIVDEFRLVVREEGDTQTKRSATTLNNATISENIKHFLHGWKNITDTDDRKILAHDAIILLMKRLMKHVDKGCLSYIPPGCGTNKNKRLHKLLNNSSL